MIELIKKIKNRLQFTGWLQYLLPPFLSVLLFLTAAGFLLCGVFPAALWISLSGTLFLIQFILEVILIKAGIRPPEPLPKQKKGLDPFDLMRSRHSCRSFQLRYLKPEHYDELISLVNKINTPESNELHHRTTVRLEYVRAPLTVWPAVNAREFLIAFTSKEYNRQSVIEAGYTLQKIVIELTRMGLGTGWIGSGADQSSIEKNLGDRFNPEKDHILCVCAVGYESIWKPLLVRIINLILYGRRPIPELFCLDREGPAEKFNPGARPFAQFGRTFEICQWSPSSYNGQTTRTAAVIRKSQEDGYSQLKRFDFFTATASRYYAPIALGIWCANWELSCRAAGQNGHFQIVSREERENSRTCAPENAIYDISWIPEEPILFKT
jgi:hypothetical protein